MNVRNLKPVKVIDLQAISRDAFVLKLDCSLTFTAGQVIALHVSPTGNARLYSICSASNNPETHILFDVRVGGELSPQLATLLPGDTVYISQPFGSFTGSEKPDWWIATGTGIAPFVSMYKSGLGSGKTIIHGARNADGFFFEHLFLNDSLVTYQRCCSAESAPGLYYGRITYYLQSLEYFPPDIQYYLCGSAEMVVQVRDILLTKGVDFSKIIAETYF